MSLGERIKAKRIELRIHQEQIASRMGITHQAVGNWEKGFSVPTPGHLSELSSMLNLDLTELTTLAAQATRWKTGGNSQVASESSPNRREAQVTYPGDISASRTTNSEGLSRGIGHWVTQILKRIFLK
jgi:transcriptional regulator with XRE-family HTH domain